MEQNYEWQLMAIHAGKHSAKQSRYTLYMNPLPTYGTSWYNKVDHHRHVHEDNQHPPSSLYTTNTLISPPVCAWEGTMSHRRVDTSSYRDELISNSEPNKLETKIPVFNSISPPSLERRNNSLMLQTSTTTLENRCQVKTATILFSEMTR